MWVPVCPHVLCPARTEGRCSENVTKLVTVESGSGEGVKSRDVNERDIILAVLQSDIAVAGLVLIFAGFLQTKASEYDTKRGDKYRWLSAAGMIPVIVALVSAWLCINSIEGKQGDATASLSALKLVLALTGIYAIMAAVIAFLP